MTEAELLAGIAAHPAELDRWLILADWLEDHGDRRAELSRLRFLLRTEAESEERPARLGRQRELLAAGLSPVVPTLSNSLGMALALVLPGSFPMGSPETDAHSEDEVLHPVTLTQPFFLGVYPVTVGEFGRFIAATGYQTEAEKSGGAYGYVNGRWKQDPSITWRTPGFAQTERHPVVCVSWNDAHEMIAWLNQEEPLMGYSLPTEAQWEYACRAGTETAYWWGDDENKLGEYAWFHDNSGNTTHPVETKKPNPWGLYHTHGHVWEWCADWFGAFPTDAVTEPPGASEGSGRVFRGGGWNFNGSYCAAAFRDANAPVCRSSNLGFRLARVLSGQ